MSLSCFDVGHERGEVFDPRLVSVVVVPIWRTSLPVKKINCVGVEISGDVDRRACFPLIIPGGEEVDGGLEFVFDAGDVIVADGVVELVESLFCEEASYQNGRSGCLARAWSAHNTA